MSRKKTCHVSFSVASSLPLWLVPFFVFPCLTWRKLFCWLLSWCPAPRASFKHPLRPLISLPLTMLFSTRFFNKSMELLYGNHWFEEPNSKYFMERGSAAPQEQTQIKILSPQKQITPHHHSLLKFQSKLIYCGLVWVHTWSQRSLKWVVCPLLPLIIMNSSPSITLIQVLSPQCLLKSRKGCIRGTSNAVKC